MPRDLAMSDERFVCTSVSELMIGGGVRSLVHQVGRGPLVLCSDTCA